MSSVAVITPYLNTLTPPPAFIADKPIWLIWRFESAGENSKPRKVPYYTNGARRSGVQGRPEDVAQLVTFKAAVAAASRKGFDGIGLATLDGSFTVLDFDKCVTDGVIHPDVAALLSDSYSEYSPSGTGIHLFVRGNLADNRKSHATEDIYGVEAFSTGGYVTWTGNPTELCGLFDAGDSIAEPSPGLLALVDARIGYASSMNAEPGEPLGVPASDIREALSHINPDTDYTTWLNTGMAIHHESSGEAWGFELWQLWSQQGAKYPGYEAVQAKWESFGRAPGKPVTIRTLIHLANAAGARIQIGAVSNEAFDNLDAQVSKEAEAAKTPEDIKLKFKVVPAAEFAAKTSSEYIIKGVLPKAQLAVLFGESGSGKSFISLDMAFAIAGGEQWRGLRTTPGRVVYIVAEGATGFRNRLVGLVADTSADLGSVPLDIIDAAPNLIQDKDALEVAKAILHTGDKPSLIIVDTFAQTLAGANENASEDMGTALANCKRLNRATGAMVLLVHHSGKDSSKGARGWSGLRAAADVELEVIRTPLGRYMRTTKQKDGADFKEWGFNLEPVAIGEDADGDVITTCVVREAEVPEGVNDPRLPGRPRGSGVHYKAIMNAIADISLEQSAGIEVEGLLARALEHVPKKEGSGRDTRMQMLRRALKKLEDYETVFTLEDDGTITLIEGEGDE